MADRKVALVTGAGSGIGRATALHLSAAGFSVGLLGRTETELNDVSSQIGSGSGASKVLVADVADEAAMRRAVAALVEEFGRLDVVVANAGVNGVWAPIDELEPSDWDDTIRINLRGTYLTIHASVPHLKAAGGGSIIIVSSINGTRTFTSPGATAYSVTKAGQLAMAQQLALELGRHRIRVNAVCPGEIETAINENTDIHGREKTEVPVHFPAGDIPVTGGVAGMSEDVAELIGFLASDASRHITGTPVWIDGGQGLLR
ncbi:SDR family oxidoreductase [Agrobacterium sp. NPDC058088]|uniref:SDR family oxidoreductase n=1 Tax=Agrobacterium sp. NPDC058088 TaxID=3346335 RepID=UPI0036DF1B47